MTAFAHGVASGDPDADRVVIWTRVSGVDRPSVGLRWRVARDPGLGQVVAAGSAEATAESDFTAEVDVAGLVPDTRYWYAFDLDGERSPVGRTRTLPAEPDHLRFAAVSCAKFNAGFFNGYARIAERDDLNFVLHLGDYIYEASQQPPASQTPGADIGRPFEPFHECKTLADYRIRYAQYRADPDTQALHHAHPLLSTLDDHEFADGAWRGGADEHKPERDGPWEDRRRWAIQARREWLPQRLPDADDWDRVFRSVSFGRLAELFLVDTRSRRDQPVAGQPAAGMGRSQLGEAQRDWLFGALDSSTAGWRLMANSSVLGQTWAPDIDPALFGGLRSLKLISADGTFDADQWDGYPAERAALLERLAGRGAIVLSGDVHVALALELAGGQVAEFVTASLTSQNLDDKMGWGYRQGSLPVEKALVESLNEIRWCDLDSHGYMVIDVTPERVQVEHWFVDGVLARASGQRLGARWEVRVGRGRLCRVDPPG